MSTSQDEQDPPMTCPTARDGDTPLRYVRGELEGDEAETFEAHYFACEECWALVHAGSEVRAAFGAAATGRVGSGSEGARRGAGGGASPARELGARRPPTRFLLPATVLAAAVAGLALFGVWQADPSAAPDELFRGVDDAAALQTTVEGGALTVRWGPVPGAEGYEVRFDDADGRALHAAVVDAPPFALTGSAVDAARGAVSVRVTALDGLGQALTRFGPTALPR